MLRMSPNRISDDELVAWVQHLVNDGIEEGTTLDYKAELSLDTASARKEALKDISAFANTIGGTIVYGIVEAAVEGRPKPAPSGHGFATSPNLEGRLQDILADAVSPRLLEIGIKSLPHEQGSLLIVWTPQSPLLPHMVTGYGDSRYYTRSGSRSRPMQEHQVEAAYRARAAIGQRAQSFLDSDWARRPLLDCPDISRHWSAMYAVVPVMPLVLEDRTTPEFQTWEGTTVQWRAAPHGVETRYRWTVSESFCWPEDYYALHDTGPVVMWEEARFEIAEDRKAWDWLYGAEAHRLNGFLRLASNTLRRVSYHGPIRIVVRPSVQGSTTAAQPLSLRMSFRSPFVDPRPLLFPSHLWQADFQTTASTLAGATQSVLEEMFSRLLRFFGLDGPQEWLREYLRKEGLL